MIAMQIEDIRKVINRMYQHPEWVVVYHADCPDGTGAAAAIDFAITQQQGFTRITNSDKNSVKVVYEKEKQHMTVEYQAREFESKVELPDIKGKVLFVVDFTLKKEENTPTWIEAVSEAKHVVWIDHHADSITKFDLLYENASPSDKAKLDSIAKYVVLGRSGARLTWEAFNNLPVPFLIQAVEDRDVHKWSLKHSKEFLKCLDTIIQQQFMGWSDMLVKWQQDSAMEQQAISSFIDKGRLILQGYQSILDGILNKAIDIKIGGVPAKMVAASRVMASDAGTQLAERYGCVGAAFEIEGKNRIKLSLRSVAPINVIPIANLYSGGGHPQASACYLTQEQFIALLNSAD